MSRRITTFVAVAALLFVGVSGTAQAGGGTFDLAWNGCLGTGGVVGAPAQNIDFAGAFNPYQMFISGTGITTASGEFIFSHDTELALGPTIPDAWGFDDTGCMTSNFSTIQFNSLGVAGCGGLRNGTDVPVTQYSIDTGNTDYAFLRAATAYPAGRDPDGGTTYLIWNFTFSMAAAGTTGSGASCEGAETQLCMTFTKAEYFAGPEATNTSKVVPSIGQSYVTFNDSGNSLGCPAVQTVESSWGRIKNLYR